VLNDPKSDIKSLKAPNINIPIPSLPSKSIAHDADQELTKQTLFQNMRV
jgi:hypothetical protein